MLTIRTFLSTYLFLVALGSCVSGQKDGLNYEEKRDLETFQKLLDQVDEPSLHEALHSFSPKKFKHGAFREDRTAVEVIHQEEPSVATSIVNLAQRQKSEVVDLSKRQDISNGTTPSNTPPVVSPQSTSRPTPVPLGSSSTPAPGTTTQSSNNPAASASPSTVLSTGASVSPSSIASSTLAAVSSSAASITSSTPSSTGGSNTYTTGQVITTTNAVGLTIISTIGGGASTVSPSKTVGTSTDTHKSAAPTSVIVQTSTLPNGSKSVVTAVTVVGAGANGAADTPTGTAGVGPTSASASPGLQTGEAIMTRGWGKEMVLVVGGAVVFAGMM